MQNASHRRTSGRPSERGHQSHPRPFRGRPTNNVPRQGHGHYRPGGQGGRRQNQGNFIPYTRFISRAVDIAPEAEFVPTYRFAELPIDSDLKQAIISKGYETPTPIQDATIPLILQGKDVVGIANTGTGKTAAFLVPLIQKVRSVRGEEVLIVVPTRELAIQIEDELRSLTKGMRIFSVVCVGGMNINPQLRALRQRNDFVIGTPGRLKDLIDRNALRLGTFKTIVLDEADRMLDMGFINDMRYLMERMPKERQTLFFSATFEHDVKRIVVEFLHNPEQISVKTRDTSKNIDQDVIHIQSNEVKVDVLHGLLSNPDFDKVLVFGRTKHGVEKLAKALIRRGIKAESIHGNKDHRKRVRALEAFKKNHAQVLVATDVAARGLDIPSVSHVINYDVPTTYEDYVHRIGRTGRADKKGVALTFIGGGAKPPAQDGDEYDRRDNRR